MRNPIRSLVFLVAAALSAVMLQATPLERQATSSQAPIRYQLSFPKPEHRWMQVEVLFPEVRHRAACGQNEPLVAGALRAP